MAGHYRRLLSILEHAAGDVLWVGRGRQDRLLLANALVARAAPAPAAVARECAGKLSKRVGGGLFTVALTIPGRSDGERAAATPHRSSGKLKTRTIVPTARPKPGPTPQQVTMRVAAMHAAGLPDTSGPPQRSAPPPRRL